MELASFVGRVLFVSVFILSAWQEFSDFGTDGGRAAKSLRPKYNVFANHVTVHTGFQLPPVDMKHLVAAAIAMKGLGGLLFVFGSSLGAYLLLLHQAISTPILYDFYNYDADRKEFGPLFTKFTQNLALLGALLFFIGMKNSRKHGRQLRKKTTKPKTN
ncbi:PREDICTED: uncharacterized protein LOC104822246 [Tarenaya hassleriana]|uniref:uncharacterized protein LOC104822246 n=1 Tax=Tarenaya hassleriana TaxID=28532 RepID=UPI00053C3F74|nr:PREDICTED: uncharacterized protein LOC104822246 [Tarenaya hassleriana]